MSKELKQLQQKLEDSHDRLGKARAHKNIADYLIKSSGFNKDAEYHYHEAFSLLEDKIKSLEEDKHMLSFSTYRDELTGMFNKLALIDRIEREIALIERSESELHETFSLVYFRLLNYQVYFNEYGKDFCRSLIRNFALFLQKYSRKGDFIAHMGDGAFMILFPGVPKEGALRHAQRALAQISRADHFKEDIEKEIGRKINYHDENVLSCSIGITEYSPEDHSEPSELLEQAKMIDLEAEGMESSDESRLKIYNLPVPDFPEQ